MLMWLHANIKLQLIFKMEILFYLLNLVVINHNYIAQLSAGNYGTRSKFRNLQLIKGID